MSGRFVSKDIVKKRIMADFDSLDFLSPDDSERILDAALDTVYADFENVGILPNKGVLCDAVRNQNSEDAEYMASALMDLENDPFLRKSKIAYVVAAITAAVVVVLIVGGLGFAFLSGVFDKPASPAPLPEQSQPVASEPEKKAETDKTAKPVSVKVTVSEIPDEKATPASLYVKHARSGQIVFEGSATLDTPVSIGNLEVGEYLIFISQCPVFGNTTFEAPEVPVRFKVDKDSTNVVVEAPLGKQVPVSQSTKTEDKDEDKEKHHVHDWIPVKEMRWVEDGEKWVEDGQKWVVDKEAWTESVPHESIQCSCGAAFGNEGEWAAHNQAVIEAGGEPHSPSIVKGYITIEHPEEGHYEPDGHYESDGHYEEVITEFYCSKCDARM